MICFICILLILFFLMFIAFWFEISSEIESIKKEDHEIRDRVCHIWDNLPYYNWYGDVRNRIDELENNLTTEIACLATKNNEDIKRINRGFQKWDIFEYEGVKFFIYDIENCVDGRILYRCQRDDGFVATFKPIEMAQANFIRSASPWQEEGKGD